MATDPKKKLSKDQRKKAANRIKKSVLKSNPGKVLKGKVKVKRSGAAKYHVVDKPKAGSPKSKMIRGEGSKRKARPGSSSRGSSRGRNY